MAYIMIQITKAFPPMGGPASARMAAKAKWKEVENDFGTYFPTQTNPELNDYLTMMESRGWTLTHVNIHFDGKIVVTLHRPG